MATNAANAVTDSRATIPNASAQVPDVRFGSLGDMAAQPATSALPPIADMDQTSSDVR